MQTGAARCVQIIDVGKFKSGQELPQGLLWVAEQLPGLIVASDMTSTLARGYYAAYNIPVFPEARATAIPNYKTPVLGQDVATRCCVELLETCLMCWGLRMRPGLCCTINGLQNRQV